MPKDNDERELRWLMFSIKHHRTARFLMRARSWLWPRLVCGSCDHFFDPADKRHYRGMNDPRYPPRCPACTIEELSGREAWALKNSCQGLWEDSVRYTRSDAQALLDSDPGAYPGSHVIPVRLYEEREDRIDMRHWSETNRDKI